VIQKYRLSGTFCRHIHLNLCSILRELNTIFGMQMVMQAVAFHVFTVQIIYECYVTMIILYDNFTYGNLVDFSCICFWIIINTIKIFVFNYTCERVCVKVHYTYTYMLRTIKLYNLLYNYMFVYYTLVIYMFHVFIKKTFSFLFFIFLQLYILYIG